MEDLSIKVERVSRNHYHMNYKLPDGRVGAIYFCIYELSELTQHVYGGNETFERVEFYHDMRVDKQYVLAVYRVFGPPLPWEFGCLRTLFADLLGYEELVLPKAAPVDPSEEMPF